MVHDPDEVARLGRRRKPAHQALLACLGPLLRQGDSALEAACQETAAAVASEIDCAACGRCCRHYGPVLDEADGERLAAGLGLTVQALQAQLLQPMWPGASAADQVWLLPAPCPLHDGLLCTAYEHRPQMCRDFPLAVGDDWAERLAVFVDTAHVCPITYNTLERLAAEIDADRA